MPEKKEVKKYPWGAPRKGRVFIHDDIVSYYEKDVIKKVGEGESDFVIEKKLTEYDRMDRQDYINRNKDRVGVKNQIAQAIRNGESADYVLNEKFKSKQQGFVDESKIVESLKDPDLVSKDTIEATRRLKKVIDKAPRDISKMSDEEIVAYLKSRAIKNVSTEVDEKSEVKENG